jgi:hypothetical protein
MPSKRDQFTLASLLKIVTIAAIGCTILFAFNPSVVFIADACLLVFVIITRMRVRQIAGFTVPRLTVVEWLVIIGAVMLLNLLLVPPLQLGHDPKP